MKLEEKDEIVMRYYTDVTGIYMKAYTKWREAINLLRQKA